MLRSLLYISESSMDRTESPAAMEHIVEASRRHNPAMGVTGALIFTGVHFAQVLEGSGPALEILMRRIASDERHNLVDILQDTEIDRRHFRAWSMAYSGPSSYLAAHLSPLLLPDETSPAPADSAERLMMVMYEFAATLGTADRVG